MRSKPLYIGVIIVLIGFLIWTFWPTHKIQLQQVAFTKLPGWKNVDAKKSLQAFQVSCKVFLKQDRKKFVGSAVVDLTIADWIPPCKEALSITIASNEQAKKFFEEWFQPVAFYNKKPVEGLFTGYYMPLLYGSLNQTEEYNVPIYGVPENLITVNLGLFDPDLRHHRALAGRLDKNRVIPYFTRKEINAGAIKTLAPILAWVNSEVDRQFLEIEGSGVVQLSNGKTIFLGYAGENGQPYTPLARILIEQKIMTRDNASMQRISSYFKTYPEQVEPVLNQNKSFVFFNKLPAEVAIGAQGVGLVPGYSLAVDRKWVPLGTPIWLNTTRPIDKQPQKQQPFQRLMIAQDTGGAIRGPVRGDVYWGTGEKATSIAGHMKNPGYYWLLLPKPVAMRVQGKKFNP